MEYVLRMCKPCFLQRIVSSVGSLILFEADSTVIWDGKPRHCVGVDSTASKSRDQSKEPGCPSGWMVRLFHFLPNERQADLQGAFAAVIRWLVFFPREGAP
jgi:hypothetical protein